MMRLTFLAAVLLVLSACASSEAERSGGTEAAATAGPREVEADLADVAAYRLSMDRIDRYFAAQKNLALAARDMTPAEREAVKSATNGASASLDDMAANLERHPALRSAVREAGLSPREFATLTMAIVQSSMAASVLQMRPNDDPDSLAREMKASMENITFVRDHEAELARKQQTLAAELRRMGADVTD